jgi:hypothetical protein
MNKWSRTRGIWYVITNEYMDQNTWDWYVIIKKTSGAGHVGFVTYIDRKPDYKFCTNYSFYARKSKMMTMRTPRVTSENETHKYSVPN